MWRSRQDNPIRRGFTMIEVLLAIGLVIFLFSGVYTFYHTALRAREVGKEKASDATLAYGLLSRMATEIRQTVDIIPGDGQGFQGKEDRITLVMTRIPERYAFDELDPMVDQLPPGQEDVLRVTYSLVYDPELEDDNGNPLCHGLWRSEQKTLDPNPNFVVDAAEVPETFDPEAVDKVPVLQGELIAPEIKYLRFEYYDGAEWHDRWHVAPETDSALGDMAEGGGTDLPDVPGDNAGLDGTGEMGGLDGLGDLGGSSEEGSANDGGYALPQMVRITIGYEPEDEDEFDVGILEEMGEDAKDLEYHEDRFTIQVYLPAADPTLLSSRKYGVEKSGGGDEFEVGGQ